MEGDRFTLDGEEAVARCDENTIGVVAILGSTFDGAYEPVAEIAAALDDLQERTGLDIPLHVDGASGGFVAPFVDPGLEWDFRLPRVASINASGHKYGLVYPGVGWAIWRDAEALPEDLIFHVNYLGDDMPTFALNFSRPGDQLPVFAFTLDDDVDSYSVFDVSRALRERGWQVPPYTFPANRTDLAVLRIVIRRGFTHDMADMLVEDLKRQLPHLERQAAPVHDETTTRAFRH